MYFFQPGQKFICHRQNLPINDLGALSYFARIEQCSQSCCAIILFFFILFIIVLLFPNKNITEREFLSFNLKTKIIKIIDKKLAQ